MTGPEFTHLAKTLGRRLDGLTRGQRHLMREDARERRSVVGTMPVYDSAGNLRMTVGEQADGGVTVQEYGGDPLKRPGPAVVEEQPGALVVTFDGFDADDLASYAVASTFSHVGLHISTEPGFSLVDDEPALRFTNPGGETQTYALPPYTTYYLKLVAYTKSGVPSVPSLEVAATPQPLPGGDPGVPPAASPALTVRGGPSTFVLTTEQVAASTQLTYHASTDPEFVPSPATALGPPTRSTVYVPGAPPAGGRFDPAAAYYFRVVASNAAGAAAPSPVVSGMLDLTAVEEVIAASVVAGFILTGRITVGNITISADEGIKIDPGDGSPPTLLSATGDRNMFSGEGTFDAITVLGNLVIRGITNYLSGTLTLTNGVPDPTQQCTIASDWVTTSWGGSGFRRRGFTDDAAGTYYVTTDTLLGASNVQHFRRDTGAGIWSFPVLAGWMSYGGVTRIGSTYHVLACYTTDNGGSYNPSDWWLLRYDQAGNYLGGTSMNIGASTMTTGPGMPIVGRDTLNPNNVMIAWIDPLGRMWYRLLDVTTNAIFSEAMLSATWGHGDLGGCGFGNAGMQGWDTLVVADLTKMFAWSAAAGRPRLEINDWTSPRPGMIGLTFTGGRWHSSDGSSHTDYSLNTGSFDFSYTWRDSDPGGLGVAETLPATRRSATPVRFARWTISLPSVPPDDGTVDGANSARIYAGPVTGTMYAQGDITEADIAGGVTRLTISGGITATGAPAPIVSGFATRASSAAGRILSTAQNPIGERVVDLSGAGPGGAGYVRWAANGTPVESMSVADQVNGITVSAGSGWYSPVDMPGLTFTAPRSGRVLVILQGLIVAAGGGILYVGPEVRAGATLRAGALVVAANARDAMGNFNGSYVRGECTLPVAGLTPGAAYNVYGSIYRDVGNHVVQACRLRVLPW